MEKLILSEEDKHLLTEHTIFYDESNGYYRIYLTGTGKRMYLHRYLTNAKKGDIVDHKDRNKHNHLRDNLRIVSKSINNFNRDVVNVLGRGIYFDAVGNRFRSCISNNNKTIKLGSFSNAEDAKKAYNKASFELRGENGYQHIVDKPHFELKP